MSSNGSLVMRMRNSSGTESTSNYVYGFIYGNPSTGGGTIAVYGYRKQF